MAPSWKKPPFAVVALTLKLCGWNLKNKMMMVSTGMATFHQVMPAFTLENRRIARKLTAVKMAIRTIVAMNPVVVTFPLTGL